MYQPKNLTNQNTDYPQEDPFNHYGHRLSYSRKKANDFQWAKDMANYYDEFFSTQEIEAERKKLRINYDLYNGRNPALADYKSYFSAAQNSDDAKYSEYINQFDHIEHHPIIDQIAKAMVGERRKRRINATVRDLSVEARNARKRKTNELVKEFINATIITPLRYQVMEQLMQQNPDAGQEQLPQLEEMANEQVNVMLPEEILEYMNNDFLLETDVQGQRLLDHMMKVEDVENKCVEGFKHGIISGKEIYRVGIKNKKPFVEVINPMKVRYGLSPHKDKIEDADWVIYEKSIGLKELFDTFGFVMKPKDLKKLDNLVVEGARGTMPGVSPVEARLVSVVTNDPRVREGKINTRNMDGQEYMRELYSQYGMSLDVELVHKNIMFTAQRKMYYVKRVNPETGEVGSLFLDESYVPNKLNGDIEWTAFWVNEIWQVDKIGEGDDALYLNMGPLEVQFASKNDPFNVKMPYIGGEYSRLMGNSRNVSVMDLGKPWQYKFNVQMAKLQELDATDLGKVLLMTQGAIPKDWDIEDFWGHMRQYKVGLLNFNQEGVTPADKDVIKGVELTNASDKANAIQYLEFLKDNIAKSMYYNPSRLGQISPYLPVTNNQQNIMQSSAQTEDLYSIHNHITERLLNALLDFTKFCLIINPDEYDYILGDAMIAEIKITEDFTSNAKLNVFVASQSEEEQNIQASKELLPYLINSQAIGFEEAIRLIWAKKESEILNLAKKGDKKIQDREAQAQQQQQQQQQAMLEAQAQQQQEMAKLELAKIALNQDINKNNTSDQMDIAVYKEQAMAFENDKKRAHDRAIEELRTQTQLRIAALQEEVKQRIAEINAKKNAYKEKS